MATLLQDAFTDSDGVRLNAHTMTGTPASTWNEHGIVAWTIASNKVAEGTAQHAVASADAGLADVVLTLDVVVPSAASYILGAAVRVVNGSNFWICAVQRDSSGTPFLGIYEYNATTPTVRASVNIPGATGTTVSLTVTTVGDSITLLAGTGETCNYASATFQNTATRHGVYSFTGLGYVGGPVDNFLVTGDSSLGTEVGKIPKFGFGAGAIKYVALQGFTPNPSLTPGNPSIPTLGFGTSGISRMVLLGFFANPSGGGGGGSGGVVFYVFGGDIIR